MRRITPGRFTIPTFAVLLLSAALVSVSCGGDESAIDVITEDPAGTAVSTATTKTAPAATTPTVEPTGDVGIPFTSGPFSGGAAEVMVLSELRFGDQDGYERVVIEFIGQAANPSDELPLYTVTAGTPPYYDAEGNLVPLYGPAYIEVRVNGNKADLSVDPYVEVYTGPDYIEPGLDLFYSIEFVPAYENNTLILLLDMVDNYPFRVIELVSPPRLVLDIEG